MKLIKHQTCNNSCSGSMNKTNNMIKSMLYKSTSTLHCLKWSWSLWCHQGFTSKKRAFHLSWNVFSCLISKEAWLISNSKDFLSLPAKWEYFAVFLPVASLAASVESVLTQPLHKLQIKRLFSALTNLTVGMSTESIIFSSPTQVHYN